MPAPLQTSAVDAAGSVGATRTINLTGVTAGKALVAWVFTYRYDTNATHVTGVSSSNGGAFTKARDRIGNSQNGSGTFRLGIHCFVLPNAAAGSHTITLTFVTGSANTVSWFVAEIDDIAAVSPVGLTDDDYELYGNTTITYGPSANLSAAPAFAMLAFCGMGTDIWNGATSGNGSAPAGWNAWRGHYTNTGSPIPGMPFAAYWADAATTAALSGSITVKNNSITDPFLMMLVTLKRTSGSFYVEVLLQPQAGITVNGSSGWTVEMSPGDPKDGATVVTNVTAQATGNELRPAAPAGVALGQTINVVAYNTALAHGAGTGVGTTRGTGIVKAGS